MRDYKAERNAHFEEMRKETGHLCRVFVEPAAFGTRENRVSIYSDDGRGNGEFIASVKLEDLLRLDDSRRFGE